MPNIALQIEYNGTAYHGYQCQEGLATIQACLEHAISKIADEPIKVLGTGRTDAGVHATAQIINFHTEAERTPRAWSVGVNSYLPRDIAVRQVWEVPETFHARYSAINRSYRYVLNNHRLRGGLWSDHEVHYPVPLNHELMQQGADYLVGEHDFTALRDSQCQARTTLRRVEYCRVSRQQEYIFLDIQANAFLHHMVRNTMGTLIVIGRGFQPPEWIPVLLNSKDRRLAGMTMPPQGLCLTGVNYKPPFTHLSTLALPLSPCITPR
jgi:tRNA pseudouridine38-40 synthase